jgi:hypothetical protein
VSKTITGGSLRLLVTHLNDLHVAPGGAMQCMIETGESASVTVQAGGHRWSFSVPGASCQDITMSEDGLRGKPLAGSQALIQQLRALAGVTGQAHPVTQ